MRSAGYQPAEPLNIWTVTDGRAGIDRFFARRSWPLPLRRDDV